MAKATYSYISLFSGALGLDIGLERTKRFRSKAFVESVPEFCETIRLNHSASRIGSPDAAVVERDIRTVDPLELGRSVGIDVGDLDLLVGGPPCQAFSSAGRRQSVQDPRGELLWEFLRFIVELRPRYFLMENVRGLTSAALRHRPLASRPERGGPPLELDELPGSVLDLWVRDLREATGDAYRVDCFEVNAVNYGAPQLRERALFVGNRVGRTVEFPASTHGPGTPNSFRTLRDSIGDLREADPVLMDFSPRKQAYLAMVPPGGNWRSLPESVQRESMGRAWYAKGGRSGWWRRLSWDLPSPNVLTMPNHASTSMCHPDEVRVLSVAECAAIQEFPADWVFCGRIPQQYEQVGNAVPVRLGEVGGEVIAACLDDDAALTSAEREAQRAWAMFAPAFRKVYLDSQVRTRQWFRNGEVFVWSDGKDNGHAQYKANGRGAANKKAGPEAGLL